MFVLCSFSFGSNGIYIGGKDVFLSEISGRFSLTTDSAEGPKGKGKLGRLVLQIGTATPSSQSQGSK